MQEGEFLELRFCCEIKKRSVRGFKKSLAMKVHKQQLCALLNFHHNNVMKEFIHLHECTLPSINEENNFLRNLKTSSCAFTEEYFPK